METAKITMDLVKKMSKVELENVLNTTKNLTPVQKQAIATRIKSLSTLPEPSPVEMVQEKIGEEAITPDTITPEVVIVAKVPKNKPNETTRTIIAFTDDTKGIRAGTIVTFLENNKPGAKTLQGKVQRVFDFYLKPERQEVKIKGDNGNRYYRFEKDLTVIVAEVAEVAAPIEEAQA